MHYEAKSVWDEAGLKIGPKRGIHRAVRGSTDLLPFEFEALNPQVRFTQCMSRMELFRLGLWFVRQSLTSWRRETW